MYMNVWSTDRLRNCSPDMLSSAQPALVPAGAGDAAGQPGLVLGGLTIAGPVTLPPPDTRAAASLVLNIAVNTHSGSVKLFSVTDGGGSGGSKLTAVHLVGKFACSGAQPLRSAHEGSPSATAGARSVALAQLVSRSEAASAGRAVGQLCREVGCRCFAVVFTATLFLLCVPDTWGASSQPFYGWGHLADTKNVKVHMSTRNQPIFVRLDTIIISVPPCRLIPAAA